METNQNSYVDDSIVKNSNENISSSKAGNCMKSSNGKSSIGGCGTTTNIIVNNLFIMNPHDNEKNKYQSNIN